LVVVLPIGAYLLHEEMRPTARRWFFLGNMLVFVATVLTFARSAWIVLLVQCLLTMWLMRDAIARLPIVRFRSHIAALVATLVLPVFVYMAAISTSTLVAGSNDTRIDLARISWEYFRSRPWLGQGPGTFLSIVADTRVYVIEYGDPLDAHGMFQKIVAEGGIIGLVTWVLLLTTLVLYGWHGLRRARGLAEYPLMVALFVAVCGALVYQVFNTSYFSGKLWLPIGLLLIGANIVLWKYRESKSFI
jgi:putative inorganic carbon (hco3(-)) transporter